MRTRSLSSPAARLLPALVLVSGFCGISYEILYARQLGDLLGDQFTIDATVLLSFLLGIGLGTLVAHRFAAWLWAIEGGIGLYAVFMALGGPALDRLIYTHLPSVGTQLWACAAAALALLALPAVLIGCSVPLFAAYLSALRGRQVFSFTYAVYNLGAAATALLLEFALLRMLGLRATTLALAALNAAVALALLALVRSAGAPEPPPSEQRQRFAPRVLAALCLASVASAVFQLQMIKLTEFVLGPFHENFALVLACVLAGLTLGSAAAARLGLRFEHAVTLALVGVAWLPAGFPWLSELYAALRPEAPGYAGLVALKLAFVAALTLLPATGFGATVPTLMHRGSHVARESGQLLFFASLANAAGFLLMAFGLHQAFDYGPLLLVVATGAAGAVWVAAGLRRRVSAVALAALVVGFGLERSVWNEGLLYVGHPSFHSANKLAGARQAMAVRERYKGPRDVFAIVEIQGKPTFFINGYFSVSLGSPAEKIVGALASMWSPRLDRALVLGVGTGATAGTAGLVFENTDAIEINAVVLDNLHRMAAYNFDLEKRPGVNIVHDDGIRFIKTSEARYSLILNTVTTPLYFSSSKLYTREFFHHVRERLTPDGVYVTWLDWRLGEEGVDIILETLDEQFAECWMAFLASGYFLLGCSNAEMGVWQYPAVLANEELRETFAQEYELPLAWLPYGVLSTRALSLRSGAGAPINTLDRPALEFAMARLQAGSDIARFRERLVQGIDGAALARALRPEMPWNPRDFARFRRLREEAWTGRPRAAPGG